MGLGKDCYAGRSLGRGHGGPFRARPHPKGGGGVLPPIQTPKWLYKTEGFVGARDFVSSIRQGEIFLFDPRCQYSKYSDFFGEFKNS